MPSDVTGSSIWNQRDGDFEFRPGPDLHQPPARRRDQPRPAEDAGGAARGDAGAAGDDRGRHAPARAAVPRARDAEPDRVRGHVPAARGAARPLPAPDLVRLPEPRRRVGGARAAARAAAWTRSSSSRSSTAPTLLELQAAMEQVHVGPSRRPLHRRPRRRDARERLDGRRRQPARHPRPAQALALPGGARGPRLRDPGRREGGRGAGARAPADAAAGAVGAAALRPTTSSATCSRPCRRRGRGGRAPAAE